MLVMCPKSGQLIYNPSAFKQARDEAVRNLTSVERMEIDLEIEEITKKKFDSTIKAIRNAVWILLPQPLTDICNTHAWLDSRFREISPTNKTFLDAIEMVEQELKRVDTLSWFDHLRAHTPMFNIYAQYMSVDDSAQLIEKWLRFQFGDEGWIVVLTTIYNVSKYFIKINYM